MPTHNQQENLGDGKRDHGQNNQIGIRGPEVIPDRHQGSADFRVHVHMRLPLNLPASTYLASKDDANVMVGRGLLPMALPISPNGMPAPQQCRKFSHAGRGADWNGAARVVVS
jgi:hypothetical protein